MDAEVKNKISHRGRALQALKEFLCEHQPSPAKRSKQKETSLQTSETT